MNDSPWQHVSICKILQKFFYKTSIFTSKTQKKAHKRLCVWEIIPILRLLKKTKTKPNHPFSNNYHSKNLRT